MSSHSAPIPGAHAGWDRPTPQTAHSRALESLVAAAVRTPPSEYVWRALLGGVRRPMRRLLRLLGGREVIYRGPLAGLPWFGELAQAFGIYEPHIVRLVLALASEGTVFYDIGSSDGFFSLVADRKLGPHGRIFAFEPQPSNKNQLVRQLGAAVKASWTLVTEAVADTAGTITLSAGDQIATSSIMSGDEGPSVEVPVTTLDRLVETHPRPALIKMDVEGAEVRVLKGATRLLAGPDSPVWIVEIHSSELERELVERFEAADYLVHILDNPVRRHTYPRHALALRPPPDAPVLS